MPAGRAGPGSRSGQELGAGPKRHVRPGAEERPEVVRAAGNRSGASGQGPGPEPFHVILIPLSCVHPFMIKSRRQHREP